MSSFEAPQLTKRDRNLGIRLRVQGQPISFGVDQQGFLNETSGIDFTDIVWGESEDPPGMAGEDRSISRERTVLTTDFILKDLIGHKPERQAMLKRHPELKRREV